MHYLAQNHVVWRIKRENWSNERVSRGSDEPRKKRRKHSKVLRVYFTYVGGKNPWADWPLIFLVSRCLRRNHVFQIWWRSVQGFSVSWGSNFAIPHWLWRSSLQHSHTTVWACDQTMLWYISPAVGDISGPIYTVSGKNGLPTSFSLQCWMFVPLLDYFQYVSARMYVIVVAHNNCTYAN